MNIIALKLSDYIDYKLVVFLYEFFFFFLASAKTLSGLLEWECKTDAVEALTALNHYQIRVPSKKSTLFVSIIQ